MEYEPMGAVVTMGWSGDNVRRLQQALTAWGFDAGRIDGRFGSRTEAAVRAFQEAAGLTVDGKVGEQTWNALLHPTSAGTSSLLLYGNPDNPYQRRLLPTCEPPLGTSREDSNHG